MEILDLPVRAAAVDGHAVGGQGDAEDVLVPWRRDAGVLIQFVGRVRGGPQAGAIHVAAGGRGGPVADVVVAVLELLTAHWQPVAPEPAGGDQLLAVV